MCACVCARVCVCVHVCARVCVRVVLYLETLGGHVLADGKLEDVLLAIDDRQRAVWVPAANVACMEPATKKHKVSACGSCEFGCAQKACIL